MGLWPTQPLWLHIIMGSFSHQSGPRHVPRGCCAPPSSTRCMSTHDTAAAPSAMSQLAGPCRVVTRASTYKRIKTEPCCALSPCHARGDSTMQRPWPEDRPWKASWQMSLPQLLHWPQSLHLVCCLSLPRHLCCSRPPRPVYWCIGCPCPGVGSRGTCEGASVRRGHGCLVPGTAGPSHLQQTHHRTQLSTSYAFRGRDVPQR